MDKFVAVRIVQANGMDLSLFQFDYDMSFAATFLNADRTVYGRYGTRDGHHDDAATEISMDGLAAAMEGALEIHAGYPGNSAALAAKQPVKNVKYPVPEKFPSMGKFKSVLDYEGKVAGSCIHCHSIHDEERRELRDAGEVLGLRLISPWPMPSVLGLRMDPEKRATVAGVAADSVAAKADLRPGDTLASANGQPLLSTADLQWVLHRMDDNGALTLEIRRAGKNLQAVIQPAAGWRASSDIGWRVSTWDLRRMALGGMLLERVPDQDRASKGLPPAGKMALNAKHVGQYGDHAAAKRAGLLNEDVIVEFNGDSSDVTESALIKSTVSRLPKGAKVKLVYLRDGARREAEISLQ